MRTITFALTLSAMLLAANAAYSYEAASFLEGPTQVLTAANDTNFKYPFVSRWIDSTYFALWGFYGDSDTAPITWNAVRRLVNTTDMTYGNDTALPLNLTLISTPVFASSTHGYVAVAGVAETTTSTNTTDNATNATVTTNTTTTSIKVYIFSSDFENDNEVHAVTIGGTTNTTLGYKIYKVWFQDNDFFVLYTVTVSNTDNTLFIAGFDKNAKLEFTTPIALNTVTLTGNANVVAGGYDEDIVVAWRQDTQGQVVYVTLDADHGKVSAETVVATDSGTTKFTPAAVAYSEEGYFTILLNQEVDGYNTGLTLSVSGSNTTTALSFALTTDATTFSVVDARGFYDGWFFISHELAETTGTVSGSSDNLYIYNYTETTTTNVTNSTTNETTTTSTTQKTNTNFLLTTDGTVLQGFTLPNQSYYVLIVDSTTGTDGAWTKGYIAQVFSQISDEQFGAVLKMAFSAVFAVVAMLFVF